MKNIKILIVILFLFIGKVYALENKIVLKIENDIITTLDIFNEINALKFFNTNLNKVSKEEIYQIALETLLKNKIRKNEIIKRFGEVKLNDTSFLSNVIQNNYENLEIKDLREFKKVLKDRDISYENYEQKLKIDIIWNQLIYSLYSNKVIINKDLLKKQVENQSAFITSYNLSEIVFEISNVDDLESTYTKIKNDINNLGFENAALKYSVSNSASNSGNLGWVNENQINREILTSLMNVALGSITKPIRIPSGFLILKKNNVKKIEKNLDTDAELKKLINYQTEIQLNNYSNIYFNKIKKNMKINEP